VAVPSPKNFHFVMALINWIRLDGIEFAYLLL